ncbi:MAG: phytanoyl-CoA dioxygenase family protein [Gammaproteobacteria bacterium]|nr:phytanoyl-CoA dioxygenase family protein [Gammaproteobacteria bacterium]
MSNEQPSKKGAICRFQRPYDWSAVDAVVREQGGAILQKLFSASEVKSFNREIDAYLIADGLAGRPHTGSAAYDRFLGHRTVRLHGLIEKFESARNWIDRCELLDWAERTLEPTATTMLLNAAELIQIGPGEPSQYMHRDSDSWPLVPLGDQPVVVNAVIALDPFTLENGATRFTPGSWRWPRDQKSNPEEIVRAQMEAGDALLFRGDVIHGGGANTTERHRRGVSFSYCAGWLRPVENSFLNVSRERVKNLPKRVQKLLGYAAYDGERDGGGLIGLYENGDPGTLVMN